MKGATAMSRPAPKRGIRRSNSFEIGTPASGPSSLNADQKDKDDDDVIGSLHALAIMKKGLCRRFSNIYEAFAFFDMKGNWRITATELELMLQKLSIGLPDVAQAMRFLDGRSKDGVIDAKEFVHMLAWHPVHADIAHKLELAKSRREVWMQSFVAVCRVSLASILTLPRMQGIAAKAVALAAAEEGFKISGPTWLRNHASSVRI